MKSVIELGFWQMFAAYLFVVILMIIVKIKGIPREKEVLLSSIRMTLQLIIAGFILVYLFENPSPFYTLAILIIMEVFAVYNVIKRTKKKLSKKMKRAISISIITGTVSSILLFLFMIVRVKPWFNPQYFIPISGMLIGNSMTGITLGVTKLVDDMESKRDFVEAALMLGATPKMSVKEIVDGAFDSAIIPTINSMVGMGIVFLPGMMTGQILSGVSPITAIEYQIAIMLGILISVTLTTILFVNLGYNTYFNEECQINI